MPIYLPAKLTGSEVVVRHISETLVRKGHTVSIYCSNAKTARYWYDPIFGLPLDKPTERIGGVSVRRLRCNQLVSAILYCFQLVINAVPFLKLAANAFVPSLEILAWGPILRGLEKEIAVRHPDFVFVSPFPAGICLTVRDICKRLKIPYAVIPFFKKDQKLFQNRLLGRILDDAGIVYCPTRTEMTYISQFTRNTNLHELPSTIDLAYVRANMVRIRRRAGELKRSDRFRGKRVVLFVGNKGGGKGIMDAAEAVQLLGRTDTRFVAIGNTVGDWKHYLTAHNCPSIVDIGYLTGIEKYAYYALSDILILPSKTDNFPLVFLEAWAFRKPVVAYDYYSMREILSDGSGYLVRDMNPSGLAQALAYLLDHPRAAEKIGSVGYHKVNRYGVNHVVEKYLLPPINNRIRI